MLIEAAWTYGHRPRIYGALRKRQEHIEQQVKEIAWKAQHRLHRRYRRLAERGMPHQKVVTAVGRELRGFIGAIGVYPGAEHCVLGFLWANTSNINRSPYTAFETVGSEGTVDLNSNFYYWDSSCYFTFFEGWQCFNKWVPFFNAIIVPGAVVTAHITGNTPGNTYVDLNETPRTNDPANPTVGIAIQ